MFGIHISKQFGSITYRSLEEAVSTITTKYDMNTCQVFLYGPQNRSHNHYDVEKLKKISKTVNIYVHSTYMTDGYWSAVESNIDSKLQSYYKHIQDQLNSTDEINGKGLVIHITRKPISIIVRGMELLEKHIKQKQAKIILEFKAMRPDIECSYERVEQVNKLCKELKAAVNLDWGICLDTSHMWATGVKMNDYDVVKKWFTNLKYASCIILIHLNAAENSTFGVGRDIHIVPLAHNDDIWGDIITKKVNTKMACKKINKSSLGFLVDWAKKNNTPIIGEFKRGKIDEFNFAIQVFQNMLS